MQGDPSIYFRTVKTKTLKTKKKLKTFKKTATPKHFKKCQTFCFNDNLGFHVSFCNIKSNSIKRFYFILFLNFNFWFITFLIFKK